MKVDIDSFRDPNMDLWMMCGSVCKDWSSMGKQEGFTGQWTLLCATMFALARRLQPKLLVHECAIRFPHTIIEKIIGKTHVDYHAALCPTNFGAPVKRSRSYDAVAIWLNTGKCGSLKVGH